MLLTFKPVISTIFMYKLNWRSSYSVGSYLFKTPKFFQSNPVRDLVLNLTSCKRPFTACSADLHVRCVQAIFNYS